MADTYSQSVTGLAKLLEEIEKTVWHVAGIPDYFKVRYTLYPVFHVLKKFVESNE